MNKERRVRLAALEDAIVAARQEAESIRDEEQGERMQEILQCLDDLTGSLESAEEAISGAQES